MTWTPKFDRFAGHYSKYQDTSTVDQPVENAVKVIDADIGCKVGFQRVAVHHIVLPAGYRSSLPHAESLEEEFVFVLKGRPDLWLNGYIHELKEGHAVGFPAGTGIAHTFINNTDSDIHLLVAGEKNKPDNLCSFPLNPEKKKSCDIWWENPPPQEFGRHAGLPGPVKLDERVEAPVNCIVDCSEVERGKPFHYPGDNETFGAGFRITDKVGLKALGIWFERLPPGRRSAFPHAHTHEEEFVYVLGGKPTLWMDGYAKQLEENHFAAFPANTGVAHTLINDTDEEVIYICVGETTEFPEEKITYPLNPLRNKECARKGWFWRSSPRGEWGAHPGKPRTAFPDHLSLRLSSEDDVQEILEIFKASSGYFTKVNGCFPSEKTVRQEMADGPKKTHEKYFKEFLIIESDGQRIGVVDLHSHHPEEGICYVGLLLIKESLFGRGLGTKCYQLVEDYIKRAYQCDRVRLGVSDENDVSAFWRKMGFAPNGKSYEWKGENKTARVQEFDKLI